ncbi:15662_t:CDS:1, partial [Gigaspora rosea]
NSSFNNPQSNQAYKGYDYNAATAGTVTVEAMIAAITFLVK